MRSLIIALALLFLPFDATAAFLAEFDGKWMVDAGTTVAKNPEMAEDKNIFKLTLVIDAKMKTVGMEGPDGFSTSSAFTLEKEDPSLVRIRTDEEVVLQLSHYSEGQIAVGEVKSGRIRDVLYFKRIRE